MFNDRFSSKKQGSPKRLDESDFDRENWNFLKRIPKTVFA